MTDEKFTELVNSYLDQEISEDELNLLKAEIGINEARKQVFVERCRLHKAMRVALESYSLSRSAKSAKSARSGSRSRSRSRSGRSRSRRSRSGSSRSTRIFEAEEMVRGPGTAATLAFPRWLLFSGMAASLLLAFVLLKNVFVDTTSPSAQPELAGVTQSDLDEVDPMLTFGRSELRRFAAAQAQRESNQHASLVSQMRLMGLRPEHTPVDKKLQDVDLAAVYQPSDEVDQAELFQRIQAQKALPEPRILLIQELDDKLPIWPGVFGASQDAVKEQAAPLRF